MNCLHRRAELLAKVREFFTSRGFTEVSTPRIDAEIIPELHIEPFEAPGLGFLQASPEMHMKRLLGAGTGPIFEIAKCFRRDEHGQLHRPEFTMVEWYRPGDDMPAGIDLLDEFCQSLLASPPAQRTTYRDAFVRTIDLDPHAASLWDLQAFPGDLISNRDHILNLRLAVHVEPHLGTNGPEIVYHYPATQSALATTVKDSQGVEVAERFELYYKGIELANGYHELTDAKELRQRLVQVNEQRVESGRTALPCQRSCSRPCKTSACHPARASPWASTVC